MPSPDYRKVSRYTSEKLKKVFQILGYNWSTTDKLVTLIMDHLHSFTRHYQAPEGHELVIDGDAFLDVVKEYLARIQQRTKNRTSISKFRVAMHIQEQNIQTIIMLGGASGTGKSSIASALATHLGLPEVLSTDSIRHIMRNFLNKDEYPFLFASTYECHLTVQDQDVLDQVADLQGQPRIDKLHKAKLIKGYLQQSEFVLQRLEEIIESYVQKKRSLVIEGVHLTCDFMQRMWNKYQGHTTILPFLVVISKPNRHQERLAVRSKYMTLEPKFNKYISSFYNIRYIQKYNLKKAEQRNIPKIDNANIDKSIGMARKTIINYILALQEGEKEGGLVQLARTFNKVSNNAWSSDNIKEYINIKVNKQLLMDRYRQEVLTSPQAIYPQSPRKPQESDWESNMSGSMDNNHRQGISEKESLVIDEDEGELFNDEEMLGSLADNDNNTSQDSAFLKENMP